MHENDQLLSELEQVRDLRRVARRQRRSRSRLDRFRADIEQLDSAGASTNDIAVWLRKFKRTHVHPTTVWRALKRWQPSSN